METALLRIFATVLIVSCAPLNLPAQSPTPDQMKPATAGPTMEQTVDFINQAFAKTGTFDYEANVDMGVHVRLVGEAGEITHRHKVQSQNLVLKSDGVTITYTIQEEETLTDTTPPLNNKGDIAKGHTIDEFFKSPKISRVDRSQTKEIHLDHVHPKVTVNPNYREALELAEGLNHKVVAKPTDPKTYSIFIEVTSQEHKGQPV
jgi:hypothetical protein